MTDFVPCPTCKQYSHSIGEGQVEEAFRHFHAMVYGHPVKGYPTDHAFTEETRAAAQAMMSLRAPVVSLERDEVTLSVRMTRRELEEFDKMVAFMETMAQSFSENFADAIWNFRNGMLPYEPGHPLFWDPNA